MKNFVLTCFCISSNYLIYFKEKLSCYFCLELASYYLDKNLFVLVLQSCSLRSLRNNQDYRGIDQMIRDSKSPEYVRDVARRVHRGRRGLVFFSQKNGGTEVRVESGLEFDVGRMLEADPRVLMYRAQPFHIELETGDIVVSKKEFTGRLGSKPRWYTPDFICQMQDGTKLAVEAKHRKFYKEFDVRRAEITAALKGKGIGLCVIANDEIDANAIVNIACLHGLRAPYQSTFVETAVAEVETCLELAPCWDRAELESRLSGGRSALLAGVLTGTISVDLRRYIFEDDVEVVAGYGDLSNFEILELTENEI